MDTKLRVKGVQDGTNQKEVRQAVQEGGRPGGAQQGEELGIKDLTLRRWAKELDELGDKAFPGNGSPKVNKDYEIVELRKKVEEPEAENELLKKFRAFLSQDRA